MAILFEIAHYTQFDYMTVRETGFYDPIVASLLSNEDLIKRRGP